MLSRSIQMMDEEDEKDQESDASVGAGALSVARMGIRDTRNASVWVLYAINDIYMLDVDDRRAHTSVRACESRDRHCLVRA
jgi:hypothetical protein